VMIITTIMALSEEPSVCLIFVYSSCILISTYYTRNAWVI
jgi:hypothetical protein